MDGATSEGDPLVEFRGYEGGARPSPRPSPWASLSLSPRCASGAGGHHYWVDPESNATTWDVPEAYAWTEQQSEAHTGRSFFFNSVTNASVWDKPAILGWKAAEKGFWCGLSSTRCPPHSAWSDAACAHVPRYNNVTHISQWKRPDALGIQSKDGTSRFWVVNGNATWEAPVDYAWRVFASKDTQVPFFENWVTNETTWERPAALAWSRRSYNKTFWHNVVTLESAHRPPAHIVGVETEEGRTYYVDPASGDVSWDKPVAASWHEAESEKADGGDSRKYFHNAITKETVWERPADSNLAWIKMHQEL